MGEEIKNKIYEVTLIDRSAYDTHIGEKEFKWEFETIEEAKGKLDTLVRRYNMEEEESENGKAWQEATLRGLGLVTEKMYSR